MKIGEIVDSFNRKDKEVEAKINHLEARIEFRESQGVRLEKRLQKVYESAPNWVSGLIAPIAEEINKLMPDYYHDIIGPFGIGATVIVRFYRNNSKPENCDSERLSIHFEPNNGEDVWRLLVKDYSRNTHEFERGTIGEVNGGNFPNIQLTGDTTIQWLYDFMTEQGKRKE